MRLARGPLRAGLMTLLLAWQAHAAPATPDPAVPLDSPAWRELMKQPVVQGDTLAYHAAAMAGAWGRPAEKSALFDALLLQHGRALAGASAPATLGELLGAPAQDPRALQAAWDAGLNQAFGSPVWSPEPVPAGASAGATPWPGRAGFWRLAGGRLAAGPTVQNRSSLVVVVPGPLQLVLQAGGRSLSLDCTLQQGSARLLPGASARWWCTTPSAVPADALAAEPRPLWSAAVPWAQSDIVRWVDQLAGRAPASLAGLAGLYADCLRLANCGRAYRRSPDEAPELRAARLAREEAEQRRSLRHDAKERAAWRLYVVAMLVAAFGVYSLVARAYGTTWAALASVAVVFAIASWASTGQGSGGWGALGAAMLFVAVLLYGIVLVAAYRWLYPVVFGRH